jgi:hypothetical protein
MICVQDILLGLFLYISGEFGEKRNHLIALKSNEAASRA